MTDSTSVMAALAAIALLCLLIGWWRAENRADRAEAARDTAIEQRDRATAAANQHWRALRRARGELERYRRNLSEADHWAGVPRETPDSNAGGHRALSAATEPLPVLGDNWDTAVLPVVVVADGWVR